MNSNSRTGIDSRFDAGQRVHSSRNAFMLEAVLTWLLEIGNITMISTGFSSIYKMACLGNGILRWLEPMVWSMGNANIVAFIHIETQLGIDEMLTIRAL